MPYNDPDQQRAYQREWRASRRAEFMTGRSCVDCGATEQLEIDHTGLKGDHRIWSNSKDKIAAELALCVVRCRSCHTKRHAAERRKHGLGGYKRGCRCEVCRKAKAESNRRYQESKAEQRRAA